MRAYLAIPIGAILLALAGETARAQTSVRSDLALRASGVNYDDACFWRDRENPDQALVFVTSKSAAGVEVFDLDTGEFLASIPGFGRANNCAVEGNLLITTDIATDDIRVHRLPDLAPIDVFGLDTIQPEGIDVLTLPTGESLIYVTDSGDASVHVYDLETRERVHAFPTGFGDGIEPIVADDLYQRVYVARGEGETLMGIGWFTPAGALVREFGDEFFSSDTEGMAIYGCGAGGYLVAADQRGTATQFEVFDRVTLARLRTFTLRDGSGDFTDRTDGLDVYQGSTARFPGGVFAACDSCSETGDDVDVVGWERIAAALGLETCPEGRPPTCGNGTVDSPNEQCDGVDALRCPDACRHDCTCGLEAGASTTTAPSTSSTTTTSTTLPPACGDGVVNGPAEACDGADAAACPGACRADCTCPPAVVAVVEADVGVMAREPTRAAGREPVLWADRDTAKRSFLRVRVSGVGGARVAAARLHLRVAREIWAESDSGGAVRAMTACGWNEATVTWRTQPPVDGPVLATAGAVARGAAVVFDLTAAIAGDGVYCFALENGSDDQVTWDAREAGGAGPRIEIVTAPGDVTTTSSTSTTSSTTTTTLLPPTSTTVAPTSTTTTTSSTSTTSSSTIPPPSTTTTSTTLPPACGDGVVNGPAEACDGADAAACPGACRADCTCPPAVVAVVEADVGVMAREPTRAAGREPVLWADRDTAKRSFLRVRVSGVGGARVAAARLHLRVAREIWAESDSGGAVRAMTACGWNEATVTWRTQPPVDGPVLATAGAVARGAAVVFDLTAAIAGDGVYCFALENGSDDQVTWDAREAGGAGPRIEIVTAP